MTFYIGPIMETTSPSPLMIENSFTSNVMQKAFGFVVMTLLGLLVYLGTGALEQQKKSIEQQNQQAMEQVRTTEQVANLSDSLESTITSMEKLNNSLSSFRNNVATKDELNKLQLDVSELDDRLDAHDIILSIRKRQS